MAKYAAVEEAVRQAKAHDVAFKKEIVAKFEVMKAKDSHGSATNKKTTGTKNKQGHVR